MTDNKHILLGLQQEDEATSESDVASQPSPHLDIVDLGAPILKYKDVKYGSLFTLFGAPFVKVRPQGTAPNGIPFTALPLNAEGFAPVAALPGDFNVVLKTYGKKKP
jgi:hypothetical protein